MSHCKLCDRPLRTVERAEAAEARLAIPVEGVVGRLREEREHYRKRALAAETKLSVERIEGTAFFRRILVPSEDPLGLHCLLCGGYGMGGASVAHIAECPATAFKVLVVPVDHCLRHFAKPGLLGALAGEALREHDRDVARRVVEACARKADAVAKMDADHGAYDHALAVQFVAECLRGLLRDPAADFVETDAALDAILDGRKP